MAEIAGNTLRIGQPERVNSSVWQTRWALISTSTSPALGPFQIDLLDHQGLAGGESDSGAGFHAGSLLTKLGAGTKNHSFTATKKQHPGRPKGGWKNPWIMLV